MSSSKELLPPAPPNHQTPLGVSPGPASLLWGHLQLAGARCSWSPPPPSLPGLLSCSMGLSQLRSKGTSFSPTDSEVWGHGSTGPSAGSPGLAWGLQSPRPGKTLRAKEAFS